MKNYLWVFGLVASLGLAFAGEQDIGGQLPVYFIENQGQVEGEDVRYYLKGADKSLYFTDQGVTITLHDQAAGGEQRWVVKLEFVGANPDVKPRGEEQQQTVFSYFKGRPEDWKTGLPVYTRLVYEELWPGIDLIYAGTVNRLKYEFLVKPGADPRQIRLAYRGAEEVVVKETGELCIHTPLGGFEDGAPYAFQHLNGEKRQVSMAYSLAADSRTYGFKVGPYDSREPLILDPVLTVYCGYIGGSGADRARGVKVDDLGNVYVVGYTGSTEASFPVTVGPDLTHDGNNDLYVAKVSADGTSLIYCGYIGGNTFDYGYGLAVDAQGSAYVTGYTLSDETSFPVLGGPGLTHSGYYDAFVAKVSVDGTGLDYCGYIGGLDHDRAYAIAVDNLGCAYITGRTESDASSFPVTVGPDLTLNGKYDAYIAKVSADGSDLVYCGYLGGSESDQGDGIAVDGLGNAYLTGYTASDETSFPVSSGPDLVFNGDRDAFVARVAADGIGLDYCGYLGGIGYDRGMDLALNSLGEVYIAGYTDSNENTFPVQWGPDLSFNGEIDAFLAKVSVNGAGLQYCGYVGGLKNEYGNGIAVDASGNAYLVGMTHSTETSDGFPVVRGPDLTYNGVLGTDAFVAKVCADGLALDYCGYIGGDGNDKGEAIAVDDQGNAYVVGYTYSTENSFPVLIGPDLSHGGGYMDAYLIKISSGQDYIVDDDNTTGPWLGTVDHPFRNIQDGIDIAQDYDALFVRPGTYLENLNFLGKSILVSSDQDGDSLTPDLDPEHTIVDGGQAGSVVVFQGGEGPGSVLSGFTITNGTGDSGSGFFRGGGIHCRESSPTISHNTITGNTAIGRSGRGGGIYCYNAAPMITDNIITRNTAEDEGGGIDCAGGSSPSILTNRISWNMVSGPSGKGGGIGCHESSPLIANNIIAGNFADWYGGGIVCINSSSLLVISSNTIAGNSSEYKGGGLYFSLGSSSVVSNTILWDNTAPEGAEMWIGNNAFPSSLSISHSDLKGGLSSVYVERGSTLTWGEIMLDVDPVFMDAAGGDYHLSHTSPCIDVGDNGSLYLPDTDLDGQGRVIPGLRIYQFGKPNSMGRIDLGADEYWGPNFKKAPGSLFKK